MYHCVYLLFLAAGECLSVTAHISSLADDISTDELKMHFDTICDDVEVSSPVILGGGKAELVLKGLTREGVIVFQVQEHIIIIYHSIDMY